MPHNATVFASSLQEMLLEDAVAPLLAFAFIPLANFSNMDCINAASRLSDGVAIHLDAAQLLQKADAQMLVL
jgi:hypothetical protein